jgi:hypothetical protein
MGTKISENKVAMPAGWPDNELIKDRVIIPPANNVADALKRKESCEDGYDWWFCHKKTRVTFLIDSPVPQKNPLEEIL